MEAGISPARQARSRHRHELRTLTYVTLDQANGGIVRNLSHEGIGVHFLDLSPRMTRQINEWIFGNLLEGIPLYAEKAGPIFAASSVSAANEDDGLMVSAGPLKTIELPVRPDALPAAFGHGEAAEFAPHALAELGWLSQPLSGRSLVWTINILVVVAALLLFVLVFLSVSREPPRWPLPMMGGAAVLVGALYWGFFRVLGGSSPGARLARLAGCDLEEDEEEGTRFR